MQRIISKEFENIPRPVLAISNDYPSALDLGYDSSAAFSTMFKRRLGIPPSHYQS